MSTSMAFFKSVFGNDSGKLTKVYGLKAGPDIIIYEEQHGRPKILGSATMSIAEVTDPDEL